MILGVGAVGGVLAAQLRRAGHDVIAIARGPHLTAIGRNGLNFATPGGVEQIALPAVGSPAEVRFAEGDIAVLAVKSQDTDAALRDLAEAAPPTLPIVCLQNGVANEPAALRWFETVYGAVVMVTATFLNPGVVAAHSTPTTGILDIGRWPAGSDATAHQLAIAFNSATFDARPLADIARWKYAKLLANLSNAVDAICGPQHRGSRLSQLARQEGQRCLAAGGIDPGRASLARQAA